MMPTRTMKQTGREGQVIYSSTFDPATGNLVRMVNLPDTRGFSFNSRWEWPKAPSPELVDIAITNRCGFGCTYCLAPDTPVLGADMVWRPLSDIQVGDRLVAFDETAVRGSHRKMRETIVEAAWKTVKPTLRVITETGEFLASSEHRWISHNRSQWLPTSSLQPNRSKLRFIGQQPEMPFTEDYKAGYIAGMSLGDGTSRFEPLPGARQVWWRVALADTEPLGRLVSYLAAFGIEANMRPFDPGTSGFAGRLAMNKVEIRARSRLDQVRSLVEAERDSSEFRRGWLAGFFDAEGSHHRSNLRISQQDEEVLRRVQRYGSSLGFTFDVEQFPSREELPDVRLRGSLRDRLRFLSTVRPALRRKDGGWNGMAFDSEPTKVLAVEPGPTMELLDIQTSTGTFFAGGVATHNCYQDSTPKAEHGDKNLVRKILEGFDQVPYQIALGGGEPTLHPDFIEIMAEANEMGTVVNYTTAGHNMTPEIIKATNQHCGGVAMTFHAWKGKDWFVEHYTKIREALTCQVNVHLIADKNIGETLPLLTELQQKVGPIKLVLLAYYPEEGRASRKDLVSRYVYTKILPTAIERAMESGMQIAFSEGLLPYFLSRPELPVDTRFAMKSEGIFSCYVDHKGAMWKSSFNEGWGQGVHKYDLAGPEDSRNETHEEHLARVQAMEDPTVWNYRSQELWEAFLANTYGPNGEACYGCKFATRCAAPTPFHYFLCAYASHNKLPLKGL